MPTGSTLTFVYGGEKLGSLNAVAYTIGKENLLENIDEVACSYLKGKRDTKRSIFPPGDPGTGHTTPRNCPPVTTSSFVRVPQGDASYGFHVIVE